MSEKELTPEEQLDLAGAKALEAVTKLFGLASTAAETGVGFLSSSVKYAGEIVEWGKDKINGWPESPNTYPEYYANWKLFNQHLDGRSVPDYQTNEIANYDIMQACIVLSIDRLEEFYKPVLEEYRRLKTIEVAKDPEIMRGLRRLEKEVFDGELVLNDWPFTWTVKNGRQEKSYINASARRAKKQEVKSKRDRLKLWKETYMAPQNKAKSPQYVWTESIFGSKMYQWRFNVEEKGPDVEVDVSRYTKLIEKHVDEYKSKLEGYKDQQNKIAYRRAQLMSVFQPISEEEAQKDPSKKQAFDEALDIVTKNTAAISTDLAKARKEVKDSKEKFTSDKSKTLPLVDVLKK